MAVYVPSGSLCTRRRRLTQVQRLDFRVCSIYKLPRKIYQHLRGASPALAVETHR